MKLFKPCPEDCYLLEQIPDIDNDSYLYKCIVKKRTTKCLDYQKKLSGIRSENPLILFDSITGRRWKRITAFISILAITISITFALIGKKDRDKISNLSKQNELLLKDNMIIKETIIKLIDSSLNIIHDSTKVLIPQKSKSKIP